MTDDEREKLKRKIRVALARSLGLHYSNKYPGNPDYIDRKDVDAMAEAVMKVLPPMMAEKDAEIAELKRRLDEERLDKAKFLMGAEGIR